MRLTTDGLILWEDRIKERNKSGMSVSEWCKKNEISKSKYHYWNHKISKIQKIDNKIVFGEVTPIISNAVNPKPNPGKSNDFQIFFKNIQVTVPSSFNEDSLAAIMKVLQQL